MNMWSTFISVQIEIFIERNLLENFFLSQTNILDIICLKNNFWNIWNLPKQSKNKSKKIFFALSLFVLNFKPSKHM